MCCYKTQIIYSDGLPIDIKFDFEDDRFAELSNAFSYLYMDGTLEKTAYWLSHPPREEVETLDTCLYTLIREDGTISVIDNMFMHRSIAPEIPEQIFRAICLDYAIKVEEVITILEGG